MIGATAPENASRRMERHQKREDTAHERAVTPCGGAFDGRVSACPMAGVLARWLDALSIGEHRQTRTRP
jgi:hypothetical protein